MMSDMMKNYTVKVAASRQWSEKYLLFTSYRYGDSNKHKTRLVNVSWKLGFSQFNNYVFKLDKKKSFFSLKYAPCGFFFIDTVSPTHLFSTKRSLASCFSSRNSHHRRRVNVSRAALGITQHFARCCCRWSTFFKEAGVLCLWRRNSKTELAQTEKDKSGQPADCGHAAVGDETPIFHNWDVGLQRHLFWKNGQASPPLQKPPAEPRTSCDSARHVALPHSKVCKHI